MDIKVLEKLITEEHVLKIMSTFGEEGILSPDGKTIAFRTLCHGGDKRKLIYYRESKNFFCFTDCNESYSIFTLVKKILKLDTIYEASEYICSITNLNKQVFGFGHTKINVDDYNDTIDELIKPKQIEKPKINIYDEAILNTFYDLYHYSFYKDNISIETMKKFKLKFDILNNRVILPHYDENNNLVCVRCRNFDKKKLDDGKKYMPITIKNKTYTSPSSVYFYGMYLNKENIVKYKQVIIFEAEKSVMQMDTYYGNQSIAVSVSGSAISKWHIEQLISLGVEEVVIAFDKEYTKYGSQDEKIYSIKLKKKILDRLKPHFKVTVMYDTEDDLEEKDSPSDKGKIIFEKIFNKRMQI